MTTRDVISLILLAGAASALGACGGAHRGAAEAEALSATGDEPAAAEASGPEVRYAAPLVAPDAIPAWRRSGPPIDAQAPEGASSTSRPASTAPSPTTRPGRPTWWINGPGRDERGLTMVAAEALGRNVLEARRMAVAAGRAALERAVEGEIGDPEVVYTAVRRLPHEGGGASTLRFVGYVLVREPAAR